MLPEVGFDHPPIKLVKDFNPVISSFNMPKFYTGSGDKGDTTLLNGIRVGKDDARVMALGDLDEANSMIGFARSFLKLPALDTILEKV